MRQKEMLEKFAEGLRNDAIDSKPVGVDWSSLDFNDTDNNQFWERAECDKCGEILVFQGGGGAEAHNDVEPESKCTGYVGTAEGPMMNYYYPLPIHDDLDADACAAKITTCLCVVCVNGQFGLALTGGGMDLSWEICQAFIDCGYLPPTHFELPKMAMEYNMKQKKIVAAMMRSIDLEAGWILRKKDRLHDTVKWMRSKKR